MIENGNLALDQLVRQLIWENDCIILPGFGAIITRENQAALNPATHTFRPKGKTIFFNPAINQTDGLLANTLSEKIGIGYSESTKMIADTLQNLKTEIKEGKKITWNGIGVFFGNDDKVFFIPETEANFLMESFGLPLIKLTPLAPKTEANTVADQKEKSTEEIYINRYQETEVKPNFEQPAALQDSRKKRGIFKWFAAACLATSLIYFGYTNQTKKAEHSATASVIELPFDSQTTTIEEPIAVDNNTTSVVESTSPATQENNVEAAENSAIAAETITEAKEESALTFSLEDQYHIIVAKSLNELNIAPNQYLLNINNSQIKRVGIASSNDKNQLLEILSTIKNQYPNAELLDKSAYNNL